jgi:endonuclease YncB( thermonuclease family)
LVLAIPAQANPREPVVVTGEARAIDGDTIEVDGTRIRLQGIDAPETRQSCTTADGASWACGRYATAVLAAAVASVEVTCTARGRDRYQRVVAVCWAGVVEVGRSMVAEGLALADRRFGRIYVPVEDAARAAARGIWAGEFEAPWDWRRARRRG